MHLDITGCSLKREEVLFIGLALTMSKTMLGLHISGNELKYYERIFLRTMMSARVDYRFKNDAMRKGIKNNKEYVQILHLAGGKNYNKELEAYI